MKYFKITSVFIGLLAVVIMVSSCDLTKKKDRSYKGPDLIEFKPTTAQLQRPVGTTEDFVAKIQLIGEQRDQPIEVSVSVVDTLDSETEGVYFTLYNETATIPADSSSIEYPIQINYATMEPGQVVEFILQLNVNPEENVKPGVNIDQLHILMIAE